MSTFHAIRTVPRRRLRPGSYFDDYTSSSFMPLFQILQLRSFANKTTQNNSNSSNNKRRKPKTINNKSPYPQTTRDRIRWLQDHNQVLPHDHRRQKLSRDQRIEDMGNVAEERLTWMRNQIYGFWRGNTTDAATTKARPERIGPTMDAKWWFWNIVLALLPAMLIAVYCEFIAKPEMLQVHRQWHIRQQKELLGDDYDENQDEELARLLQESEPLTTKVYHALSDLSAYFWSAQQDDSGQQHPHQQQQSSPDIDSSSNDTKDSRGSDDLRKDDIETIAALKQRLEALERHLLLEKEKQQGQHSATQEPSASTASAPPNKNSIHSRIHDRVEAQRQREAARLHQAERIAETNADDSNEKNHGALTSLWEWVATKQKDLLPGDNKEDRSTMESTNSSSSPANDAEASNANDSRKDAASDQNNNKDSSVVSPPGQDVVDDTIQQPTSTTTMISRIKSWWNKILPPTPNNQKPSEEVPTDDKNIHAASSNNSRK